MRELLADSSTDWGKTVFQKSLLKCHNQVADSDVGSLGNGVGTKAVNAMSKEFIVRSLCAQRMTFGKFSVRLV